MYARLGDYFMISPKMSLEQSEYINVQEHYLTVISLTEDKACAFDSGNKNTRSKTIYNYL